MTNIEDIRGSMTEELVRLNALMREALASSNPFLNKIVEGYLDNTGKQIRPILVILSAEVSAAANSTVINAAAAIELLHNATLIHDDVLDESVARRGSPTVNYLWDNQVAVLTGDYFVSKALKCATSTGDIRIVQCLSTLGADLSVGEIDQIDHARKHDISEESYFEIIRCKTASLFRSCVEVGCYAVNAPAETIKVLGEYAELLGLAFQIRDDIFDYFDTNKSVGKPTGNDLREGKITLPLIYALYNDDETGRAEKMSILEKEYLEAPDVAVLVEYAKQRGGIEYAYGKMQELRAAAAALLAQLPKNAATERLEAIFDFTIQRKF